MNEYDIVKLKETVENLKLQINGECQDLAGKNKREQETFYILKLIYLTAP